MAKSLTGIVRRWFGQYASWQIVCSSLDDFRCPTGNIDWEELVPEGRNCRVRGEIEAYIACTLSQLALKMRSANLTACNLFLILITLDSGVAIAHARSVQKI